MTSDQRFVCWVRLHCGIFRKLLFVHWSSRPVDAKAQFVGPAGSGWCAAVRRPVGQVAEVLRPITQPGGSIARLDPCLFLRSVVVELWIEEAERNLNQQELDAAIARPRPISRPRSSAK